MTMHVKDTYEHSEQETFDIVARHLLTQRKRAAVANPNYDPEPVSEMGYNEHPYCCKYRLGDLKCAAGCLMPDDAYKGEYENRRVLILAYQPEFNNSWFGHNPQLCECLQGIHDSPNYGPEKWAEKLIGVANEWCLDPRVVTETENEMNKGIDDVGTVEEERRSDCN